MAPLECGGGCQKWLSTRDDRPGAEGFGLELTPAGKAEGLQVEFFFGSGGCYRGNALGDWNSGIEPARKPLPIAGSASPQASPARAHGSRDGDNNARRIVWASTTTVFA